MSNPLENTPHATPLQDRYAFARALASIDRGVYAAERIAVTAGLLVMSGAMCLYILYQFTTSQSGAWQSVADGSRPASALWPTVVGLLMTFGMSRAIVQQSPSLRSIGALQWTLALTMTIGVLAVALATLWLPSWVVCSASTLAICVFFVLPTALDTPLDGALNEVALKKHMLVRSSGVLVATVVLTGLASWVPTGYSWAQKLALFLLLWAAFIGASMATHERRHLTIDAMKKVIPASLRPWHEGISNLVAALLSGAFCYLAFRYWQLRLDQETNPGEIPDWIKVLAIPFALALVTIRFTAFGVGSMLVAVLVREPSSHSPSSPTASATE